MAPLIFAALAMRLRAGLGNSGWVKGGTSLEGEVGGTAGATPSSALATLAAVAALAALALALTDFLLVGHCEC